MLVIIFQVILGIFFMITGTRIISGKMANEFSRFGLPPIFNFLTGFIEIICSIGMIVGIWYPIVALLSGLLLGATMLVAVFTLLFPPIYYDRQLTVKIVHKLTDIMTMLVI